MEEQLNVYQLTPGWKRYLNGWRFKRRIQRIEREFSRFVDGGSLLDVGCGTGGFLYGMSKSRKWKLHGLEMNREATKFVTREFGIPVYIGTLEEALPPDVCFDVVILRDVFEHFRDSILALQKLKGILKKKDGLLVIKMPNPDSVGARIFGPYWFGYSVPQHYFTWPSKVFCKFVEREGLKIVGTKYLYGAYSDYLTSNGFALEGRIPRNALRIGLRILSEMPFEIAAYPFIRAEIAIGRSSSLVYFIRPLITPKKEMP